MSKKRANITLDEWVKDELDRREDVNISGAANEFFKRYISGDDGDTIAKEMRIKRLKEREQEAQEQAQQYRAEWQALADELEEQEEDKAEALDSAADALSPGDFDQNNRKVEYWTDEADVSTERLEAEVQDRWT